MGNRFGPLPAQLRGMGVHMQQNDLKPQLPFFHGEVFLIIKNLGDVVNPGVHTCEGFPIRFPSLESFFQESLQALKWNGKPLFSATRSIEALIWVRRSCNLSPGAASGGCPSSVSALRTAKQYSRTMGASSPSSSSRLLSIVRMPRTCFFSSFF